MTAITETGANKPLQQSMNPDRIRTFLPAPGLLFLIVAVVQYVIRRYLLCIIFVH